MASREYQAALEQFPKGIAIPGDTYEDVRRKFAPAHGHDPGPDIETREATLGGVAGVWTAQKGEQTDRVICFFHGGAFVSCPAQSYTFYAAWFVRAAHARAFILDYPLAPESRFPKQLDAAVSAYRALIRDVEPSRIAFAGDSCGGGIALATLVRLRVTRAWKGAAAGTVVSFRVPGGVAGGIGQSVAGAPGFSSTPTASATATACRRSWIRPASPS